MRLLKLLLMPLYFISGTFLMLFYMFSLLTVKDRRRVEKFWEPIDDAFIAFQNFLFR